MTHNINRKQSGAAMIEFVIVLPFLLMLLFGVVEFSNLLMQLNTLNKLTMDASRYLSKNAIQANGTFSISGLTTEAENLMKCGIASSSSNGCDNISTRFLNPSPTLTATATNPTPISMDSSASGIITMTVEYDYQQIFNKLFGSDITPDYKLYSTIVIQGI